MKKKVLVTAIGTVTSTAIVKELKKTGDYYILGADINNKNEIATALDVDEFYVFPAVASKQYLDFVLDFCRKHKIDYYYAVLDIEVVLISMRRDLFSAVGTRLCVVNYEFAEMCHYKNRFYKWIERKFPEIGIKTYDNLAAVKAAGFPVFIKPVEGVASSGCRRIDTWKEFTANVDPGKIGTEIIVQEYTEGVNITVDCIQNKRTGQQAQIQRRELLRNANGCGIAVEIFYDSQLEKICNSLMEQLGLHGVANMEFFETHKGYKIIEINPRYSAGTLYSCMAGSNPVLNALYIADEKTCEFKKTEVGAQFAERYEVYRMD